MGRNRGHFLALGEGALRDVLITGVPGGGAGRAIANLTMMGRNAEAVAAAEASGVSAAAAARFGKAATVLRVAGRPLVVVAVAADAWSIYQAENSPREITSVVGGWTGARLGVKGGAWMAAQIGGGTVLITGQAGPQVAVPQELATVPLFGAIGGLVGGRGGGVGGYFTGREVTETVYGWVFE